MKRIWILFIAVALLSVSCNGQENKNKSADLNSLNNAQHEDINAPQEDVTVNKEYDEDGNLIKYDSTYTYFYSNIENDPMARDSIYSKFRTMFDTLYPFSYEPYFNDFFFEDSLLKYDFYKNDFFLERFKQNQKRTEKMFEQMDSLKNEFFLNEYPK